MLSKNKSCSQELGSEQYVYCKYITIRGRRIYPKKGKAFRIPLSKLNKRK